MIKTNFCYDGFIRGLINRGELCRLDRFFIRYKAIIYCDIP